MKKHVAMRWMKDSEVTVLLFVHWDWPLIHFFGKLTVNFRAGNIRGTNYWNWRKIPWHGIQESKICEAQLLWVGFPQHGLCFLNLRHLSLFALCTLGSERDLHFSLHRCGQTSWVSPYLLFVSEHLHSMHFAFVLNLRFLLLLGHC